MLESLRTIGNSKVFRLIFALFLIIPFGLFGIDYYFKAPIGGDTIATVGNQRIGATEFDQALRQQADMMRQQFKGNFDAALLENPEVRRSVLDRLVAEKLVHIGAERAGLRFPDSQLARKIGEEPFFQVDGKFSQQRYDDVAKGMGLTPLGLDERLRQDYRQQQFRGAIADTAIVPRATLDSFIRLSEQMREVSVVMLAPDAYLAQVKVTPDQVKAYYEANPARFTIPERARVEYLELSTDALAAQTAIPAEDVKQLYEQGLQRNQWGEPEQRRASHILLTAKPNATDADKKALQAKAEAIAAQVRKAPNTFAEVAKKESQDPGSAANGGDLGFFGRGAMVKAFEEAAFKAKKDEIVGPVQSDFGWHVIRVTDIKAAKVKSLAEATPEIEAQLKKAAASRRFAEASEQFSNLVYEQSSSLKPAAETLKLTVQTSPWLTKGAGGAPPLSNPKLMAEIFSDDAVKAKRNTSAVEVAPGVLVAARVLEHKPAELRPLDSVRPAIEAQLQREEAMKLAKADGETKLKALQSGQDPGLKWPQALAVNRQKPGGLFPQVIDRVFRVDGRKLPGYAGVESPAGYALVRVSKVIEPEKIDDAQRAMLGSQLRQAVAVEELEAALGSLRGKVGVNVRRDALEKKPQG